MTHIESNIESITARLKRERQRFPHLIRAWQTETARGMREYHRQAAQRSGRGIRIDRANLARWQQMEREGV